MYSSAQTCVFMSVIYTDIIRIRFPHVSSPAGFFLRDDASSTDLSSSAGE